MIEEVIQEEVIEQPIEEVIQEEVIEQPIEEIIQEEAIQEEVIQEKKQEENYITKKDVKIPKTEVSKNRVIRTKSSDFENIILKPK